LRGAGLRDIRRDATGNVIARLPGKQPGERAVILSGHLDTVFPDLDSIRVQREGTILRAPGIGDDAAGLAAVVHLARALRDARVPLRRDVVVVGTVGEEGEGDLRGVKALFAGALPPAKVHAFLTLDLGMQNQIVNAGVGSRRMQATIVGPGGHSWGDFGRPNPIHALARGVNLFLETPLPEGGRSSYNVGIIEGGRGVNVIPERASIRIDLRSEKTALLQTLEASFRAALDSALAREHAWSREGAGLELDVTTIGDRPIGSTPADSPLVRAAVAAFATQSLRVSLGASSTDANLPMSLGVPALALPHGCRGHDAHSLHEWCDTNGRPAVLAAELLCTVFLAEVQGAALSSRARVD
jgi:acetylornithine deacetylase/succinyl-diaminopimelate desuccinylase-like protein